MNEFDAYYYYDKLDKTYYFAVYTTNNGVEERLAFGSADTEEEIRRYLKNAIMVNL